MLAQQNSIGLNGNNEHLNFPERQIVILKEFVFCYEIQITVYLNAPSSWVV